MLVRIVRASVIVALAAMWIGVAAAADPPASPTGHGGAPPAEPSTTGHAAGQGGSSHGGGKGEIDPLGLGTPEKWNAQKDLALWTGAVFLVFFAILWKFAWNPLARGLDAREQRIADQIGQAQASNEEARRLLGEYQKKLAASEAEVREIIEQGRRDAEQVGQQILQKAKAETEVEKQRALREIEVATAGAIKELAEQSATLAVGLAGKLVQAEIDPKTHRRLIEQAVADFGKVEPSKN